MEDGESGLAEQNPNADDMGFDDLSDINLENVAKGMLLLGFIFFIVNALMAYLFMRQKWIIIWPQTGGAKVGVVLMTFGAVLYGINKLLERRTS